MIVSHCFGFASGILMDSLECSELSTIMRSTEVVCWILQVLVLQVLTVDGVDVGVLSFFRSFFFTFFI